MKVQASTIGVVTIAIPNLCCPLDHKNWQEVLKLLRDIFAQTDVQFVVYTLEQIGVHAMSSEGDADSHADDEMEPHSESIFMKNRELENDFTKHSKSCQPFCEEQFPVLAEYDHNNRLSDHYRQYQPKERTKYAKDLNFRYSDISDDKKILPIDTLVDARDIYSQHNFLVGKTRQKFHVTLEPSVELKRQRSCKVPLQLKGKL